MSVRSLIHRLFPTPTFLEMSAAHVVLSDSEVLYASLAKKKGAIQLKQYEEFSLEKGVIEKGRVKEGETLTPILTKLQDAYSLKFINTTLPQEKGFVYTTTVTKGSNSEVRENIAMTFEENVPLSINSVVFDFDIIHESNDEYVVTVFAFPTDVVTEYLELFKEAGMTPLSFDPEARALARAVIEWGDARTHILVHIKEDLTNISVVADGKIHFTSVIYKGLGDLTPEKDDFVVKDESFEGVEWLRNEVDKITHYWDTHGREKISSDKYAENIIVHGQGIVGNDVQKRIVEQLGSKIEIANVWTNVLSFDTHIPDIPYEDSFKYGVVIGVALKQFM